MKNKTIQFTEREINTIHAVLSALVTDFEYDELNKFIGSRTISDMATIEHKLTLRWFCERKGKAYEELTEEDFEEYYEEEYEA